MYAVCLDNYGFSEILVIDKIYEVEESSLFTYKIKINNKYLDNYSFYKYRFRELEVSECRKIKLNLINDFNLS